ncbi:MAG: GNAT family N-acetyltransferase [Bacteroidetes bacterium]|nr:GNAT family N-acetyltransferase [Bacteroidota bacterium]
MNIHIRPYQNEDDVTMITVMIHRAFKPLADAGMRYLGSYQDEKTTLERFSRGRPFVALDGDAIIGTITFYTASGIKPGWPALFAQADTAHFGQFAVDPNYQKAGIGSKMMDHVERLAADEGFKMMAFDTSEHATDLIKYYTKRGYTFDGLHQWQLTNYRSVLMKKSL